MATFLSDLFKSIFIPGPTPTLLLATNISFAALQTVLLVLLIVTYSVHFIALSVLCTGLWCSINWFVRELQAATIKEEKAKQSREIQALNEPESKDESGTETEGGGASDGSRPSRRQERQQLNIQSDPSMLRQRRSLGEVSTDRSTDSEWEKVSEKSMGQ